LLTSVDSSSRSTQPPKPRGVRGLATFRTLQVAVVLAAFLVFVAVSPMLRWMLFAPVIGLPLGLLVARRILSRTDGQPVDVSGVDCEWAPRDTGPVRVVDGNGRETGTRSCTNGHEPARRDPETPSRLLLGAHAAYVFSAFAGFAFGILSLRGSNVAWLVVSSLGVISLVGLGFSLGVCLTVLLRCRQSC